MNAGFLNWLNMPPVWLLGAMAVAWFLRTAPGWPWIGGAVMLAGAALLGWAAVAFRAARTTIIPREHPSALVAAGPYRFSRNPIYIADCVILAGWCVAIGAPWGLLLVPLLGVILDWLFIRPEEKVLDAELGEPYRRYRAQVRRWL